GTKNHLLAVLRPPLFEGEVEARNASNGAVQWRVDQDVPASGGPGVGDGLVVIGTRKAEVLALSAANGELRWRARVSSEVLSVPRVAMGVVVVHTLDGKLVALDAASGERRWEYGHEVPVLSLRGNSSPVIKGASVISGFANGKLASLDLISGNLNWEITLGTPSGRTELDRMTDIDADPLVIGDNAYVVTFQGDLAAISTLDGSVLWRQKLSSYSGLGGDSTQLYVTDASDHVLSFDPTSSSALWRQSKMQYRRLTAPIPFMGYVVAGDYQGYLHWLKPEDGSILARTRVGSEPITAAPRVVDDRLYIYGDGGEFAAITLGGGS
ncbi:MAG: outer membrane protein assembly factor BamB, partial [Gammaproteobacteria bacterium]|nr:outer membrane protein assembly factor BamB [Gammaproteobacteria bacterium]